MDAPSVPTVPRMAAVIFLACSISYFFWRKYTSPNNARHRPPGPKPLPLIGNLLDMPLHDSKRVYMEWGAKYKSDILFANVLGTNVLVLNKLEDALALLEDRSSIYSDRTQHPVIDMLGWDVNIALMQYGPYWREHKKICQQHFRREASNEYHPVLLEKRQNFLRGLLERPEGFVEHTKLFSVSVPLELMYGYSVESVKDPVIEASDGSVFLATKLLFPGGSYVNVFPVLRYLPAWLPFAHTSRVAAKAKELTLETIRVPMERLKKNLAAGKVVPSVVSSFIDHRGVGPQYDHEEKVVTNVAYTVYGGASDTTISATGSLFYALALYPSVQRKAQAELDRVLGSGPGRLPTFSDRGELPYIEAIYHELLRWRPPLPICVPHASTADDWYKGYFIPKGTAVFANVWAMTRNTEVYDEPESFRPERFLDARGNFVTEDARVLAYGFGRRICVGKHVASSTMWLTIASILAAFDISPVRDESGSEIPPDPTYEEWGLIDHKMPFDISITPRSDRVRDLLAEAE